MEKIMPQLAHTIAEACVLAKIGRTTLYAAIKSGDLKARKFRRRTVILHEELVNFLQSLPEVGGEADVVAAEADET
jgi:excisionase family DNA binding protein